MNCLTPFSSHPSPSGSARVVIWRGSDPVAAVLHRERQPGQAQVPDGGPQLGGEALIPVYRPGQRGHGPGGLLVNRRAQVLEVLFEPEPHRWPPGTSRGIVGHGAGEPWRALVGKR
jgi:hypothetical protein